MSYLVSIGNFYRENKIHPLEFACIHERECEGEAQYHGRPGRFGPKASFVGSKYGAECENGKSRYPRLVFVSLDAGNIDYCSRPEERTPEWLQKHHEEDDCGPSNPHWRGTHLLALRLLNACDLLTDVRDSVFAATGRRYLAPGKNAAKLTCVTPCFAHVNSAKCCANSPQSGGSKKAPGGFFVSCCRFTQEELQLLDPDVVITQGVEAAQLLSKLGGGRTEKIARACSNERIMTCPIGERDTLWIKTSHPRYPKGFWSEGCPPECEKHDWCDYAKAVSLFVKPRLSSK